MRLTKNSSLHNVKEKSVDSLVVVINTMNDDTHLAALVVSQLNGVTVDEKFYGSDFGLPEEKLMRETHHLDIIYVGKGFRKNWRTRVTRNLM